MFSIPDKCPLCGRKLSHVNAVDLCGLYLVRCKDNSIKPCSWGEVFIINLERAKLSNPNILGCGYVLVSEVVDLGNRPVMNGTLSLTKDGKRENVGKVALWEAEKRGEKSPKLTGHVTVGGAKYWISLWDNSQGNGSDKDTPQVKTSRVR